MSHCAAIDVKLYRPRCFNLVFINGCTFHSFIFLFYSLLINIMFLNYFQHACFNVIVYKIVKLKLKTHGLIIAEWKIFRFLSRILCLHIFL